MKGSICLAMTVTTVSAVGHPAENGHLNCSLWAATAPKNSAEVEQVSPICRQLSHYVELDINGDLHIHRRKFDNNYTVGADGWLNTLSISSGTHGIIDHGKPTLPRRTKVFTDKEIKPLINELRKSKRLVLYKEYNSHRYYSPQGLTTFLEVRGESPIYEYKTLQLDKTSVVINCLSLNL